MLANQELFDTVEAILRNNGTIARFEEECGAIKGRMMILQTEIPAGIAVQKHRSNSPTAFEASFDFYDSTVGIAIDATDKEPATGVWVTPQKDGAEPPDDEWVEFFIRTLISNIAEDGSFSVPIYSFVNDKYDMTVVPEP